MFLFIIAFFLILFVIAHLFFDTDIQYLTKDELYAHLIENKDGYYDRFHKNDLKVRNVTSVSQYLEKIKDSVCNIPPDLQEKLTMAIKQLKKKEVKGIDMDLFLQIPWKIGCVRNTKYENGLPHTRGQVIILPLTVDERSMTSLCRLLMHEKVHVYQKLYPERVQKYFETKGIRPIKKTNFQNVAIPANPDIDDSLFKNYGAWYESTPIHFEDVQYTGGSHKREHPLEEMAYEAEN